MDCAPSATLRLPVPALAQPAQLAPVAVRQPVLVVLVLLARQLLPQPVLESVLALELAQPQIASGQPNPCIVADQPEPRLCTQVPVAVLAASAPALLAAAVPPVPAVLHRPALRMEAPHTAVQHKQVPAVPVAAHIAVRRKPVAVLLAAAHTAVRRKPAAVLVAAAHIAVRH